MLELHHTTTGTFKETQLDSHVIKTKSIESVQFPNQQLNIENQTICLAQLGAYPNHVGS